MSYNVLSGTVTGPTTASISITGTFTGDGEHLSNTPGPETVSNAANNRLITFTSVTGKTLYGESNLTFDGSLLSVTGDLTASQGVSASYLMGDGSGITNIAAGAISGTARHYSATGLETSGYLKVSGSIVFFRRAISAASATASVNDYILAVDSTSNQVQIEFDATSFYTGSVLVVKDEGGNAHTNNIILSAGTSQTIDGATTVSLESPHASVNIYTNGENWFVY